MTVDAHLLALRHVGEARRSAVAHSTPGQAATHLAAGAALVHRRLAEGKDRSRGTVRRPISTGIAVHTLYGAAYEGGEPPVSTGWVMPAPRARWCGDTSPTVTRPEVLGASARSAQPGGCSTRLPHGGVAGQLAFMAEAGVGLFD